MFFGQFMKGVRELRDVAPFGSEGITQLADIGSYGKIHRSDMSWAEITADL